MGLTRAQRRKQNKANAKLSRGPTSPEGKAIASLNRLKSGLTAKTLILPTENPEEVRARVDAWHNSLQPLGHNEEELVDQVAQAAQRIQRIAKAENAMLTKQVANAEVDWKHANDSRLLDLTERLRSDPARTRIDLMAFGFGVTWLLERWVELLAAFEQYGGWNNPVLVDLALRLEGIDPEFLSREPLRAYELLVLANSCIPHPKDASAPAPALARMSQPMSAEWVGQHGTRTTYDRAEAQQKLRSHITSRVAELTKLAEEFRVRDEQSLALSSVCALVPRDTPQNQLLVRYMRTAATCFDKAYKTLQKRQAERQEALEIASQTVSEAASKVGLPNEPELVAKTSSKRLSPGTCVTINETKYQAVEVHDGYITLYSVDVLTAPAVSEVVPTPETVV